MNKLISGRWVLVGAILVSVLGEVRGAPLEDIRVVNDRAPDCSSLEALVESVTRDCKTDDERAIAIYNACYYLYYHHAYPTEPGGVGALKMVNVYGWSLCGGEHTVLAALWEKAGFKWRYRGWSDPGHTTVECFYGGRWHYLDSFLRFYAWMPDADAPGGRTIAGQEDIKANPALVTDGFVMDPARKVAYHKVNQYELIRGKANWTAPAFMVCGDTLPGVLSGVRSSKNAGSPRAWAWPLKFDDPEYSTAVNLDAGYALTLDWDKEEGGFYFGGKGKAPGHTCGDKDYRNCPSIGPILEPYGKEERQRNWSNGTLTFKPGFGSVALLGSLRELENVEWTKGKLEAAGGGEPGRFVVEMASPYVVAKGNVRVDSEGATVEVSKDGKAWEKVDGGDLTGKVHGLYRYFVRVSFEKPVTGLEVTSLVQHNQEALPYLAPGKNTITIDAGNREALEGKKLVVTYAYSLGSREVTKEEIYERGAEISRGHWATWSEEPVVVQKVVDKFPCALEIVVPTKKGEQPVYPRMLFLRREVLAPGEEAMAVPAEPSVPTVGEGEVLGEVPNPWLIGSRPPEITADGVPKKAATTKLDRVGFASKSGKEDGVNFVKWLKDDSEAWIYLIGTDGVSLPAADDVAEAKLVFHVEQCHDKANMQVAAVELKAPFESGKGYDFGNLGETAGSVILKKGEAGSPKMDPPRRVEIDVTRAVRAWAKGAANRGLALRIVPNRSVDDGWTVRFNPDAKVLPELVVTRYVDGK